MSDDSTLTIPREIPLGIAIEQRTTLAAARETVLEHGLEADPWYFDREGDVFVQLVDVETDGTVTVAEHTKSDTISAADPMALEPDQPIEVIERTTDLQTIATRLENGTAVPVRASAVANADHVVRAFARSELGRLSGLDWTDEIAPLEDAEHLIDIAAALFFASASDPAEVAEAEAGAGAGTGAAVEGANDQEADSTRLLSFGADADKDESGNSTDVDDEHIGIEHRPSGDTSDRDVGAGTDDDAGDDRSAGDGVPGKASVTPAGQFDEIEIDGVPEGAIAIDYGELVPRLVVDLDSPDQVSLHDAGDERQTLVVNLPSE